jgi:hypothetical protein
MADTSAAEAQILYLEPDDEIPSVVRRVRESELPRLVLVAPGRSKATSSAIGLRLLARHAKEVGRELSLVADPAARALAAEAGIPAFASLDQAQTDPGAAAMPAPSAGQPPLAAIHVVRGEAASPPAMPVVSGLLVDAQAAPAGAVPGPSRSRIEDTQAVPVVPPASAAAPSARALPVGRRQAVARISRSGITAIVVAVLAAATVIAAVLPSASVRIVPSVSSVGPVNYVVTLPGQSDSGQLQSSQTGSATGTYSTGITRSTGTATFLNYSSDSVQVPKGTSIAAGDQVFTTNKTVTVPATGFFFAGRRSVDVTAAAPGTGGNVAAHAINRVVDKSLDDQLSSGFPQIGPRVDNEHATAGGTSKTGPQVTQADVDALVRRVKQDLAAQLASLITDYPDRTYAAPQQAEGAQVPVPAGTVGTKDKATFQLSGSLAYDRRYVTADQVTQAATTRLSSDTTTLPSGTMLVTSSVVATATNAQQLGDLVSATISAQGAVTRRLDYDALKSRIAGLSAEDAARALADVGSAHVDFWPGWVNAVPRLPFRIDISVETPTGSPSPLPGESPS